MSLVDCVSCNSIGGVKNDFIFWDCLREWRVVVVLKMWVIWGRNSIYLF